MGLHWCVAQTTRSQLRAKYNLAEEPCSDCLTHCCCSALAVWYVDCYMTTLVETACSLHSVIGM